MAYMTCVAYMDFFIFFIFILFYLITSFLHHISWLFGHEEMGRHLFGRRINRIFFKKRFCFQKDSTYIISMGESVIKGKKIRKESRLQKEGMRGFSSSRFGKFFRGRLTYKRERRKGKRKRILLIVRGEKVQQPGTKQLKRRTCRYASRFLLYHHLVSIFSDFFVF